ncbi:hypothetical protein M408DRAFT_332442, partial [Serendipita vermifera MAFF 305830]
MEISLICWFYEVTHKFKTREYRIEWTQRLKERLSMTNAKRKGFGKRPMEGLKNER